MLNTEAWWFKQCWIDASPNHGFYHGCTSWLFKPHTVCIVHTTWCFPEGASLLLFSCCLHVSLWLAQLFSSYKTSDVIGCTLPLHPALLHLVLRHIAYMNQNSRWLGAARTVCVSRSALVQLKWAHCVRWIVWFHCEHILFCSGTRLKLNEPWISVTNYYGNPVISFFAVLS